SGAARLIWHGRAATVTVPLSLSGPIFKSPATAGRREDGATASRHQRHGLFPAAHPKDRGPDDTIPSGRALRAGHGLGAAALAVSALVDRAAIPARWARRCGASARGRRARYRTRARTAFPRPGDPPRGAAARSAEPAA